MMTMLGRAWFFTRTQGNLECLRVEIQRRRRAVWGHSKQKCILHVDLWTRLVHDTWG